MKVTVVRFYDVIIGVYSSVDGVHKGQQECLDRFGLDAKLEEFEVDSDCEWYVQNAEK